MCRFDLIQPRNPDCITLLDFKRNRLGTRIFLEFLFDHKKSNYIDQNSENVNMPTRDTYSKNGCVHNSWNRFVSKQYVILTEHMRSFK